ncbi:hypothetical protein [Rhodococcus sp. HNM0569]|uniref:hypothetical protein n=1 Tax=Rhodococcus sp. HNM0569 TaxID=2716340 RepID=UPI00146A0152|nr:hypothetical protein [Rhodococcus sp. HNM0569]NLU83166.1 hypothetical protein [Rhodococcus sp. HNM0569]
MQVDTQPHEHARRAGAVATPAGTHATRPDTGRIVLAVAFAAVAAATILRGVLAFRGNFYWDDLILTGRAAQLPMLSGDLLLFDHDGHFMPGAFFVADVVTTLFPLQWPAAALTLIVAQVLASLAVLRVLWLLMGPRPLLLVPLVFYLLGPLTLPSFSWWAAALNALPLQAALAWVAGDALLLARTGRRRYAITGVVAFALALAFFEKSVLVPFAAFVTVALTRHVDGGARPIRDTLRRCAPLWWGSGAVLAVWALVQLLVVDSRLEWRPLGIAAGMFHHGTSLGLLPTLLGGPWLWDRWPPSPPWVTPPTVLVVLGWVAVLAAIALSVAVKRRVVPVWCAVVAYVVVSETAMVLARASDETAYELAQTLRYLADTSVVLVVAFAIVARAPRRDSTASRVLDSLGRDGRTAATVAITLAFAVSSAWSTYSFDRTWQNNPTTDYLANARASLAAHQDVPLLDQPVSIWVLLPVAAPWNQTSHVFAPLDDRPEFARSTPELRRLDDSGRLVHASVSEVRAIGQGPVPGCGYRVEGATADIPLDGPLLDWEWTAELHYFASDDGAVAVRLDTGDTVDVPVRAGLNTVYVQLHGGGSSLHVTPATDDLALCFGAGPIGAATTGTEPVR